MYFMQDIYLPKEDNAAAPIAHVHEELWHDIQDSIIGTGPGRKYKYCFICGNIYYKGPNK